MKNSMILFSLLVVFYCQMEVLGLPQRVVLGWNHLIPKPVAPLPAQEKYPTFSDVAHGSNGNYSEKYPTLPGGHHHGSNWNDSYIFRNASDCSRNYGYAYDISAGICSKTGIQAHCGKNMIFYKYSNSFGACDCNSASRVPLFIFRNNQNSTSRCYFIYTQGYCDSGYWLEADYVGGPRCAKNACYTFGSSFGQLALASRDRMPEYVPLNSNNGTCTKLFEPSPYCRSNEVVTFVGNNKFASCSSRHYYADLPCST